MPAPLFRDRELLPDQPVSLLQAYAVGLDMALQDMEKADGIALYRFSKDFIAFLHILTDLWARQYGLETGKRIDTKPITKNVENYPRIEWPAEQDVIVTGEDFIRRFMNEYRALSTVPNSYITQDVMDDGDWTEEEWPELLRASCKSLINGFESILPYGGDTNIGGGSDGRQQKMKAEFNFAKSMGF